MADEEDIVLSELDDDELSNRCTTTSMTVSRTRSKRA